MTSPTWGETAKGVKIIDSAGTPMDSAENPIFVSIGQNGQDAFGRLRTSDPANRADIEFIYDKQPELIDEVLAGGASATYNPNGRDIILGIVNATNGTSAALYSYDAPYTPGNSQLIDITGTLDNGAIGKGTGSVFLRSNVTGSIQETVYPQTTWKNPMPDLNWQTSQILSMDFQSLKVGRIRFIFIRNGINVLAHEIHNDNIRSTGFWQLPSLPFYWRIYNTGGNTLMEMGYGDTSNAIGIRYQVPANVNASLRAICATVKSEGGLPLFDMPGFQRATDNGTTPITVSTSLIPVISIRPAATLNGITNRALYIPTSYQIKGDNPIRYVILYRPTLTNPNWIAVDATYSGMEVDVSASAITGGIVIESDYLPAPGGATQQRINNILGRTLLKLGRTGTADILSLAAIRTGSSNSTTLGGFKWKEIR